MRKVIESSPKSQTPPLTNGHHEQPDQVADEVLEVVESPQSELVNQPLDPESPLFVPDEIDDSPAKEAPPEQRVPAVHVPAPPSSYLAGNYQTVSSSEVASSPIIPARTSPEPSQYQPDTIDTSKSTEDTTEISLAPTTPSEQTRSVPVNLRESSIKVVPDSQTIRGSASFIPSATEDTSLPTPETQGRQSVDREETTEEPRAFIGRSTSALSQGPTNHQSDTLSSNKYPEASSAEDSEQVSPPVEGDLSYPEAEAGVASQGVTSTAEGQHSSPSAVHEDLGNPTLESPLPNGDNSSVAEEEEQVEHSSSPIQDQPLESEETEYSDQGSIEDQPTPTGPASGQSSLQQSQPKSAASVDLEVVSSHSKSQAPQPPHTTPLEEQRAQSKSATPDRSRTSAERSPYSQAERQLAKGRTDLSDQRGTPVNSESHEATQTAKAANTAHVDLTDITQDRPTSINRFTVTPPTRRAPTFRQWYFAPQPLNSSAWHSSFPFETQVARHQSSGTVTHTTSNQRPDPVRVASLHEEAPNQFPLLNPRSSSLPIGQSSQVQGSSPILPPPSQSIEIRNFGESAPARPQILSTSIGSPSTERTMDVSQTTPKSGESASTKLRAMRERYRKALAANRGETPTSAPTSQAPENAQPQSSLPPEILSEARLASPMLAAQDRHRSPSAVPHMEPLPVITQEEMNTAGRYETLVPQAQADADEDRDRNGSLTGAGTPTKRRNTDEDAETESIHAIPIGLIGHQRDQYPQMIYFYRGLIRRALTSSNPDEGLLTEAQNFINRIRRIAMHPDLDNAETLTQYDVEPSQQAKWDVSCSAKFRFLEALLDSLRYSKLHIVLVAQLGRIVDILETFLRGIRVPYSRTGAAKVYNSPAAKGDIRVTLLSADVETQDVGAANLVIAMDNSIKHDTRQIRSLRQRNDKWSPLVTLVIPYSVEHVDRCLSKDLSDRARCRALIGGMHKYRSEAGKIEEDQLSPRNTGVALAQYLTSTDGNIEWPLVDLTDLEDLDSQTDSEIELTDVEPTELLNVGHKRSREPDAAEMNATDPNKRSRVESPADDQTAEMPSTINPRDMDITHISDSIEKTTEPEGANAEASASSPTLNSTETRLRQLLEETQERLQEHVQALSDLQYRHEEQRNKLFQVTTERDSANSTTQQAVTRLSEQSNKMSSLRVENSALKEQLQEANARLLDHHVPERAEFEALRLSGAQATADKEKLEKRLIEAGKETAYARELYQNASSSAQTLANQSTGLENQLAVAQNKATGERAKLRQMGYDAYTKKLQTENKKLKAMVSDREAGLKFRDEEIARMKEASSGRMGTRGTSVPRSPRLGSVEPRVRSRQASPAAGDLRGRGGLLHPLRQA